MPRNWVRSGWKKPLFLQQMLKFYVFREERKEWKNCYTFHCFGYMECLAGKCYAFSSFIWIRACYCHSSSVVYTGISASKVMVLLIKDPDCTNCYVTLWAFIPRWTIITTTSMALIVMSPHWPFLADSLPFSVLPNGAPSQWERRTVTECRCAAPPTSPSSAYVV